MTDQLAIAVGLVVLALAVLLAAGLVLRRILISRRGGVVVCALRHGPERPWQQGVAEYRRGQLYWHRAMSMRLRPHAAFDRSQFVVLDSRPASAAEDVRLGPGMVVVRCRALIRHRGRRAAWRELELAMCPEARTGLLSWLESSPVYRTRGVG